MKSILFFHHSGTIGGAGLSGLNVLNALNKSEYSVTVFCAGSDSGGMIELFENNGYKVLNGGTSPKIIPHFSGSQYSFFSPLFWRSVYNVLADISNIKKTINSIDPDIVVMNSMTLFWISIVAKKVNKETVLFFRETYTKGLIGFRNLIIKSLITKYVDKVAFISNYEYVLSNKIRSYKTTIYNAIDEEKFGVINRKESRELLNLDEGVFYILYVGGMTYYKGAHIAIEAMKYIENPNIKLIFIGYKFCGKPIRIKDKKGVLRKIKYLLGLNYESTTINNLYKYKLLDKIQFYPNQNDMVPFYKACDCLIQPIVKPHQARPVFEAGFVKIPVVITDFPQIREICDEASVFLFDNENSKMLAKSILEIYTNQILVKKKVDENYKRTKERHNITTYNEKINALFSFSRNK